VLNVEFLYSEDCPVHKEALALLRQTLLEEDVPAHLSIHRVETTEEAELHRFPGSPTIRVAGHDIETALPEGQMGLCCRVYRDADGGVLGVPPRQQIVDALRRAR
jgi:hypothetical protein